MRRALVLSVACSLASHGCFDDIATSFEPGLDQLEANEAPRPDGVGALSTIDGEEPGYVWVHGRGVIAASPAEVWAAAKDPDRVINKCQSDSQTVETDVEEDYELSFKVSYLVETAFVDVAWDELWRYGTPGGDADAPQLALIRYQKTFGSDAIELLEGSIQILATGDPGRTEVQFVEHLASIGGGPEEMTEQMQQRFGELQAGVAGEGHLACPE